MNSSTTSGDVSNYFLAYCRNKDVDLYQNKDVMSLGSTARLPIYPQTEAGKCRFHFAENN